MAKSKPVKAPPPRPTVSPKRRGMDTLIFRTMAPYLTALMVLFSVFVLLRGHNQPGGGFIGGLIAASAFAILGIANGVSAVRRALWFDPIAIAAAGLAVGGTGEQVLVGGRGHRLSSSEDWEWKSRPASRRAGGNC